MRIKRYLRTADGDNTPGKLVFIALLLLVAGLAISLYGLTGYLHWRNIDVQGSRQKAEIIFARTQTTFILDYSWDRQYLTARYPAGDSGVTKECEVLPAAYDKYKHASLGFPIEAMAVVHGPGAEDWALDAQIPFEYGVSSMVAVSGASAGLCLMICALLGCWYQYWRPLGAAGNAGKDVATSPSP